MTDQTGTTPPEFVPIEEAAHRMGVGKSTLYHAIKDEPEKAAKWGAAKVGGRVIIRRTVFDRFMRGEPAPKPIGNPFLVNIGERRKQAS